MSNKVNKPDKSGEIIAWGADGRPIVPENPFISYIEGDGTGPDIWASAQPVFDNAVHYAYKGRRLIRWHEVLAGEKAQKIYGAHNPLPEKTYKDISRYGVAIKGPLTTPVGGGFRSINVALRKRLDLYACVRPVRYFSGVPAPVIHPEKVNVVIFRENTEDVYAGIEWEAGSQDAKEVLELVNKKLKKSGQEMISLESSVGIKTITKLNSCRLVRSAIQYAIENGYHSVTLVHKGNIMKFTEGAFRDWGYQVAREEFSEQTITEAEIYAKLQGKIPPGKVVIKDRIADVMFQQLILRPEEYGVIATPNLNGDYLSDAVAAQVGGLGMAPGGNIGNRCALFEATHGSAPKYAGQDKVNPSSVILSGVEMFRFMGWVEAAELIIQALIKTIAQGIFTYDLARHIQGAQVVKCSEFGAAIVKNIKVSAQ
ncbi:MAG: isocitrate dehydrogenase (NADP(+)) [Desulfatiglandales bacterium]